MALTNSGQISMGDTAGTNRSIFQEKTGLTRSTVQAQNISLRGLSVDGIDDYEDEDGDGVDVAGTPNNAAPYAMSEFYNYSRFTSQSTGGTFNQWTSGKNDNVRRRMINLTDSTLVLGTGSTIYTITAIESEDGTAPPSGDSDHIQNIRISGNQSGNVPAPNGWSTVSMGGSSSITWSLSRTNMTAYHNYNSSNNRTYWYFSTGETGTTVYLPSSGTGTLTFS